MASRTSKPSCALSPGCVWPKQEVLGTGSRSEMRIAFDPGNSLYFTKRQNVLIVMLAGGDKSTQARHIKRAQKLLQQLELE